MQIFNLTCAQIRYWIEYSIYLVSSLKYSHILKTPRNYQKNPIFRVCYNFWTSNIQIQNFTYNMTIFGEKRSKLKANWKSSLLVIVFLNYSQCILSDIKPLGRCNSVVFSEVLLFLVFMVASWYNDEYTTKKLLSPLIIFFLINDCNLDTWVNN